MNNDLTIHHTRQAEHLIAPSECECLDAVDGFRMAIVDAVRGLTHAVLAVREQLGVNDDQETIRRLETSNHTGELQTQLDELTDQLGGLAERTSAGLNDLAAVIGQHRRHLDQRIAVVADGLAGELTDLQTEVTHLQNRAYLSDQTR